MTSESQLSLHYKLLKGIDNGLASNDFALKRWAVEQCLRLKDMYEEVDNE